MKRTRIRTEEQKQKAAERRKLLRYLRQLDPVYRKRLSAYNRMYYLKAKGIIEPVERAKQRHELALWYKKLREARHNGQEFTYSIVDFVYDLTN